MEYSLLLIQFSPIEKYVDRGPMFLEDQATLIIY